jgi:uncharacterized membrane protein YeaQ/YmgE (transglycosylase-associated protein family)
LPLVATELIVGLIIGFLAFLLVTGFKKVKGLFTKSRKVA